MSVKVSHFGRIGAVTTAQKAALTAAAAKADSAFDQQYYAKSNPATATTPAVMAQPQSVAIPTAAPAATPSMRKGLFEELRPQEIQSALVSMEAGMLRSIVSAANAGTGARIAGAGQSGPWQYDLTADEARRLQPMVSDELMRRGAAGGGTAVQMQTSAGGQKTSELAPAMPGGSVPTAPAAGSFLSKYGMWMGVGAAALLGVGAIAWSRKRRKAAPMPSQVQGWFDTKRKKRKSRR